MCAHFFYFCPLKNLLVPHPNFDADAATNQPYLSVGARWQNFSDISIPFPIVPKFSMILPTFPPFFRSIFSPFPIFSPHHLSKRGHSTPLILLVLASIVILKHMLSTDWGQNFATSQMICQNSNYLHLKGKCIQMNTNKPISLVVLK